VLQAAGLALATRSRWWRRANVAGWVAYGLAVTAAVAAARPRRHGARAGGMAVAFPVMHGCWGAGFVASWARSVGHRAR